MWLERHTDEVTSFEWPWGCICPQRMRAWRVGGWVNPLLATATGPWMGLCPFETWSRILKQPQRQSLDTLVEGKNPKNLRPSSSHLDCKGARGLDGNVNVNPPPPQSLPNLRTRAAGAQLCAANSVGLAFKTDLESGRFSPPPGPRCHHLFPEFQQESPS